MLALARPSEEGTGSDTTSSESRAITEYPREMNGAVQLKQNFERVADQSKGSGGNGPNRVSGRAQNAFGLVCGRCFSGNGSRRGGCVWILLRRASIVLNAVARLTGRSGGFFNRLRLLI